ncbi:MULTISPECIES: hypothetical protein [Burkholderia]|uniref:Lipoprotein n=1 Tax=Burkholderia sola TaxID=2843302 RepID=A0ABV2CHA4_9BURK|nr:MULTISPECIES: hypothetical protein [unclassified Burkholderia]MBP0610507.1 hypothetical protein [Burkholderia sp. CpTa8-5]MBP0711859.1 hypothetical protein [Burkholderia sp. AcTa6-5]
MRNIFLLKRSIPALILSVLASGVLAASDSMIRLCQDEDCRMPLVSEPYKWMTIGGRTLIGGVTDENGNARVVSESDATEYVLETVNRRLDYYVEPRCWNADFERCVKMNDSRHIDGFDAPESRKRRGQEAAIEEAEKNQIVQTQLSIYREIAENNDDPLAWLGPLPKEWPQDDVRLRWSRLTDRISEDVVVFAESGDSFENFRCKTPAEFGAVPDKSAVENFMAESGSGKVNDATWDGVMLAARKGNWQARWFVYAKYRDVIRRGNNLALFYRVLQLKEWLVSHQIGPVYLEFSNDLAATGLGGRFSGSMSPEILLAAQRGSYTAMSKVGHSLEHDESPDLKRIGKAMVACAKSVVPEAMR